MRPLHEATPVAGRVSVAVGCFMGVGIPYKFYGNETKISPSLGWDRGLRETVDGNRNDHISPRVVIPAESCSVIARVNCVLYCE